MRHISRGKFGFVILAAAVLATLLTACGGDGNRSANGGQGYVPENGTTVSIESISKAQFLKRINGSCRRGWPQIIRGTDAFIANQDPDLSERSRFAKAVQLTLLSRLDIQIFDEIRTLGAPLYQNRKVEEIIGPFQIAVELGWKGRWRAHSVSELASQFSLYNQRAQEYGLDDCLVNEKHLAPIET